MTRKAASLRREGSNVALQVIPPTAPPLVRRGVQYCSRRFSVIFQISLLFLYWLRSIHRGRRAPLPGRPSPYFALWQWLLCL